ncbi:MAG: ABC transporter ATP-binding protein [Acidobacteriia bacterium]|nr:ABC transporter ATP-binding protein [Terriglobia bacterium]
MLALEGLTKSYGSRRVLDGLDLRVEAGESVALLGANGSGKTTTLRCIVGLARPDAGRIAVNGVDAIADPTRARRGLCYLPQKPAFPSTLTVRETLGVVARLRALRRDDIDREIDSCGLTDVADCLVGNLSGGERQRLALAVALLPPVDVYLFDEPSSNLDPAASRILFARVRQLKREGRTLLFTTHVPADVQRLATRVVMLRNGRIESDGRSEFELRRYERMLEQFLWGDDHDDAMGGVRGGRDAGVDWLRETIADAGVHSARPR